VGPGLVGGKVGPKIVGPKIVGPKIVGPGKVGPDAAPAPRSITPPARPSTAPAGGTGRPTPTATTTPTPAPSAPRQKDTSITDMIGRSQVRQGAAVNTGSSTSDARAIAARSSVGATPKPAPSTATAKPTPRQARLNMEMEYDTFDTVLEYLVAEGYADTEESALVIMANMSEEWRESILLDENIVRTAVRGVQAIGNKISGAVGGSRPAPKPGVVGGVGRSSVAPAPRPGIGGSRPAPKPGVVGGGGRPG
jgi:hypothetical protein